jgi:signal transduction histidine kinase
MSFIRIFFGIGTICFFVSLNTQGQARSAYPNPRQVYKDDSLELLLRTFKKEQDTIGVIYTHLAWLNNDKSISFEKKRECLYYVYQYKQLLRRHSGEEYCQFLITLSANHDNDYKSLRRSLSLCDTVLYYAQQHRLRALALKALQAKMYCFIAIETDTIVVFGLIRQMRPYEDLIQQDSIKIMEYYYHQGFAHMNAKQYSVALKYFLQTNDIAQRKKNLFWMNLSTLFVAKNARLAHQLAIAQVHAGKAFEFINTRENIYLDKWAYEELALLSGLNKDYSKANYHWQKYWETNQKIDYIKAKQLNRTGINYELMESELQQANIHEQLLVQESQQKNQFYKVIFMIGILLVLLLSAITIGYQQRNRVLVIEKQMALFEGQEQERAHISKELHDDIGSTLMGIKAQMAATRPNITLINKHLDQVYHKVRSLSHTLHSEEVKEVGLKQACQDFIHLIDQQNVITFASYGHEVEMSPTVATMAYRSIQELLSNALRHAKATRIELNLFYQEKQLLISVEDNGQGNNSEGSTMGIGLSNIQQRINIANGSYQWNSSIDGTTCLLTIPIV